MARITVGKQYKEEFGSIYRMFRGARGQSFLSSEVGILSASEDRIVTATDEFIYDPESEGFNSSSEGSGAAIGFKKSGASWFAPLRGEKMSEDLQNSANWQKLIEAVAADYHRNYSFIEYKKVKDAQTKRMEEAVATKFTSTLLEKFFPGKKFSEPKERPSTKEDIYGLSLRLDISGGMGQTEPILCKVYFSKADGRLRPLAREEAARVDRHFDEMPDESVTDRNETIGNADLKLVDDALGAFGRIIEGDSDNDFSSYAYFGEETSGEIKTDMDRVRYMLDHLANSEVKTLECSGVKVLGISHVQWENSEFSVAMNGKDVLNITVGLNFNLSLNCTNCKSGDSALIINNEILFEDEENLKIVLDPLANDFGVTPSEYGIIASMSNMARHLKTVSCPNDSLGEKLPFRCTRIVCDSQMFEVDKGVYKCKNCNRSEIVYRDIFAGMQSAREQEYRYTPNLEYAQDRGELYDKSKLKVCSCCGRKFMPKTLVGGECPTCRGMGGKGDEQKKLSKKRYTSYKNMLDPMIRLAHAFNSQKYCNEDDGVIVFVLGRDRYIFDKALASDSGYIAKPVKASRRAK